MNANRVFIDTNLLVYLYSSSEKDKAEKMVATINHFDCVISTQVLNEFCNVCLRKLNHAPNAVKKSLFEIQSVCDVVKVTENDIFYALSVHEKYGYTFYDSLIVATAMNNQCVCLFTEDLADGQVIFGAMEIRNILAHS